MLKKLVKYGNSNALILDRAILELLNIGEGAVVKLHTDGKSIIITPHEKVETEKVSETYTNNEAHSDFIANKYLDLYKNVDESKRASILAELKEVLTQQKNVNFDLLNNADFMNEWKRVTAESLAKRPSLAEHQKVYENLKAKYSNEQTVLSKKIKDFELKYNLEWKDELKTLKQNPVTPHDDQMQEKFKQIASKYKGMEAKEKALLNNPEYQHELQMIAEKYKNNQNSVEYFNSMRELGYKYLPELKEIDEELKPK